MERNEGKASRREFLGALGAAAALPLAEAEHTDAEHVESSESAKPRNIVLIVSDDHRFDFMGFLGKPGFLETPNMDRLACDGAHLENATVTTALCSPSRASILTGLYSHRHGVVDNNTAVPEGVVFFPQYLQQAGYETAFIGKWHIGDDNDDPRPGFDHWVSFRGQGEYHDPLLNVDGDRVKRKGYVTDILTDHALEWLKKDRNKPFFLYLSHKAVHAMFEPAERHLGRYDGVPLSYPATMADSEENYRGKPDWVREQRDSWHGVDFMYHDALDFDSFYRRYCETLLALDESIGRVLDGLGELGLDCSTLVIYMGDNGFSFGEHGLIDKRHMYEESMRVPMLACCPEIIAPGAKIKAMVQNIDVAPTILDAAGLRPPERMDGRSFLPLLMGRKIRWRDAVFYEYYWERNFPQTPTVYGIRTERHKYIRYHGVWDVDELYDIKEDPEERRNLIDSPKHKKLVEKLNRRVFDWLERTDGMNIPLRRDKGVRQDKRGKPSW
ncbi:MAG: sulfatase, partial [Vicinamibacteria bacterium]|nr:sulfatase [Vicinamibacteria bacterium]